MPKSALLENPVFGALKKNFPGRAPLAAGILHHYFSSLCATRGAAAARRRRACAFQLNVVVCQKKLNIAVQNQKFAVEALNDTSQS